MTRRGSGPRVDNSSFEGRPYGACLQPMLVGDTMKKQTIKEILAVLGFFAFALFTLAAQAVH